MAMPTVAFWAEAGTPVAMVATPASASARNVVFNFSIFHSLLGVRLFFVSSKT
jgi:hypothetical protein